MGFIKWLIKSIVFALVLLFLINTLGTYLNINIPINIYTILILAIFRFPGAIGLLVFYLL